MPFTKKDFETAIAVAQANPSVENISRVGSICATGYETNNACSETALAWYMLAAHAGSIRIGDLQTGIRQGGIDGCPMNSGQITRAQSIAAGLLKQYFPSRLARQKAA